MRMRSHTAAHTHVSFWARVCAMPLCTPVHAHRLLRAACIASYLTKPSRSHVGSPRPPSTLRHPASHNSSLKEVPCT
eukprot:11450523-Alexandrium_andersonii.AAC.1